MHQATLRDYAAVEDMVLEFMKDYKLSYLFPNIKELILPYLTEEDKLCLIDEQGIVAFEIVPMFAMARIALVYIKPEFRKSGLMESFLSTFEIWGRHKGCKRLNLGVSTGADLTKRGYSQYEVLYMKDID